MRSLHVAWLVAFAAPRGSLVQALTYTVYSQTPSTWYEARIKCSQEGSQLAKVASSAHQEALKVKLEADVGRSASSSFWIGAYDSYLEGSFLWLDGSHVDYNDAWANNNPAQQEGARTNSDCMRVAKVDDQWRWLDAGCDVALDGFACSPISPPLPPSPPAPPLVCCSSPPLAQLLLITRRQNFACCLPCFRRSISPAGRDFDPQPGTPSGGSSFNGRLGRAKACCLSSHRCAMSCCQG